MATNAKIDALTISIAGLIDPSLLRSFAEVENKLKAFGSSVKTQNAIMSQVYKTSFASLAPAAEDAFSKAQKHASYFHDFMGEVKSTMVGVFAVDMAQRFFDAAIEGAKSFGREMKAASDMAANMEIQRSNLQAATQLSDKQM